MNTKELLTKIAALGKRNTKIKDDIQELGLVCLQHIEDHGDVMPLNRLVAVLQRSQTQAFAEWCLAFGKVQKNTDKATMASLPLSFDKTRTTDIQGATDKPWDEFADSKAESVKAAFDLQKAVQVLLKKAAAAGQPQSILNALAAAAGVDAAKVPHTVAVEGVENAVM